MERGGPGSHPSQSKIPFLPCINAMAYGSPENAPTRTQSMRCIMHAVAFFFFFIARAPTMTMTPDRVRAGRRVWSKCGDYLLDGFTLPRNHLSPEP